MRRGINIRKKKKIMLKELNSKSLKVIAVLGAILAICIGIYFFFIQNFFIKKNLEKDTVNFSSLNENIPFSIKEIILFSSATAESDSINQLLSLNISQYCDIGIYLNRIEDPNIFISSLYIDNIQISSPEIGTPFLYKKSVSDLGKCSFDENNIIENSLHFTVTDSNSDLNYNKYELSSNGNTPIALGFYNKDIKKDFILDTSEFSYNGSLLKRAFIPLSSLSCNISLRLNIITNLNEHYICNINFDIPLNESIYETGYVTQEFKSNEINKFIRLK